MQTHNFESVGSILNRMVKNRTVGKSIKYKQLDIFSIKEEIKDDPNETFE